MYARAKTDQRARKEKMMQWEVVVLKKTGEVGFQPRVPFHGKFIAWAGLGYNRNGVQG